jgi:hypothetical protein
VVGAGYMVQSLFVVFLVESPCFGTIVVVDLRAAAFITTWLFFSSAWGLSCIQRRAQMTVLHVEDVSAKILVNSTESGISKLHFWKIDFFD